jgi:hypothetical protein
VRLREEALGVRTLPAAELCFEVAAVGGRKDSEGEEGWQRGSRGFVEQVLIITSGIIVNSGKRNNVGVSF